jgi:GNAT superfamily N-acetyltransferase
LEEDLSADIRPLIKDDLPAARRILRTAFGTFLGAPDPENFWADLDYVYGRFAAEHVASFAAEIDGELVGSNFVTRWGSVGFFGPITVRPNRQAQGIGKDLVEAVSLQLDIWGTRHAGLFTFPQSAMHLALYQKFGFYARFLTAIMAAPARSLGNAGPWSRYSELAATERDAEEASCRELTEEIYEGLDLSAEIRTVAARGLGDTILMWETASRLAGFAICHWGPASEAGAGCCFVKFGAVRPGPGAERRFTRLLDACGELATAAGMEKVLTGVNLAREEAYRQMAARGFRTEISGVTMHRPNEPGYSRPGVYVLDDWR